MLIKHYFINKIAHSSYILAGSDACAVIDPQRDIDVYIKEARELGVVITHILQTHMHADFISGHMDLAEKTGAKIYVAKMAECTFDHVALSEGDTIEIEDIDIKVLETPGHSPDHLCFVVVDRARGDEPVCTFVGDTLFVGDVGRPDIFPDIAQELSGKLYHSLFDKILKLPDFCEVLPAHGAGSLCGRAMGAKWRSTIGYEKKYNAALQIKDKTEFIKSLTDYMPPAPDHFSRCNEINRKGPALISQLPRMKELNAKTFKEMIENENVAVVDTRSYLAFGSQHIHGSWSLDFNGNLPTFAGWVLPIDKDLLVVSDSFKEADETNVWLRRVGQDRVVGYLDGGMSAWVTNGYKTNQVTQISAEDLHEMVTGSEKFVLLDVRAKQEFEDSHIEKAVNIPVADLRERHIDLNKDDTIITICSSGNRSSLGVSILSQHGFKNLYNVAGGMSGYSAAGYAKRCAVCQNPHGSRYYSRIEEVKMHFNQ
ncbi:glyoxylase-like metal-dependent hydrolase (beta-lactamase superfamily II) [Natronoflexus pectinivorans]|uniref:Glyoxylase-like metal-dependent hydrolase (Beta-lactamase superfamily II) n=2 Tax=Natronoflexus pectinivorans TaxID=682526 RepID=A0A4R2GQP8_9BACT|nr:glyoxylase-like metal-dependent hydrolase (beta-lactamase superfamily II) [Natronoflexus pectinivorans]